MSLPQRAPLFSVAVSEDQPPAHERDRQRGGSAVQPTAPQFTKRAAIQAKPSVKVTIATRYLPRVRSDAINQKTGNNTIKYRGAENRGRGGGNESTVTTPNTT